MGVSVAMATYNGENYVEEQLISILQQSLKPDEIVISDDGSTDRTLEIINKISKTSSIPIKVILSKENLGFTRNFEKAILNCKSDFIFLADQDDYFFEYKFEIAKERFIKKSDCYIYINNMILADSNLVPTQFTQFQNQLIIGQKERDLILGCGTCLRHEFKNIAFPIPKEWKRGHDLWIHSLAESINSRLVDLEPLQYYRRHETNVSQSFSSSIGSVNKIDSIKRSGLKNVEYEWILQLERENLIYNRLIDKRIEIEHFLGRSITDSLRVLNKKISSLNNRINSCRKSKVKRFLLITKMYLSGEYKYFNGYKSYLKDLIRANIK